MKELEDFVQLEESNKEMVVDIIMDKSKKDKKIILPQGYLPNLPAKIIRKYVSPIKTKRINSKKEARERKITPCPLYKEAIEKTNPAKWYAGISWAINGRGSRNFFFVDLVEGWRHFFAAGKEIETKRYDIPEELEREKKERNAIREEISKITGRKKINLEEEILRRGGKRYARVPSTTEENKFYDIMFTALPVVMPKKEENAYALWFELESRHYCEDKLFFISYIRPREEWFCKHEIATYTKLFFEDNNRDARRNSPYLFFTPFPKPSTELFEFYYNLERVRKPETKPEGIRNVPLDKIEKELLICRAFTEKKAKLF